MTAEIPHSAGVFGARDTGALKKAFEATCERLKIPPADTQARLRIAERLLELANNGVRDLETLSTAIER